MATIVRLSVIEYQTEYYTYDPHNKRLNATAISSESLFVFFFFETFFFCSSYGETCRTSCLDHNDRLLCFCEFSINFNRNIGRGTVNNNVSNTSHRSSSTSTFSSQTARRRTTHSTQPGPSNRRLPPPPTPAKPSSTTN